MESHPNPCPRTCDGLLRLLATYQKLLTVLFGNQCKHFLEVRSMRRMLVRSYQQYEKLLAESIAQILWNIHLDARLFFSTPILPDGTLPESQLRCANAWLSAGSIKLIEGCPVDRLLGVPSAPAAKVLLPALWRTGCLPPHRNTRTTTSIHSWRQPSFLPATSGPPSR